MKIALAGAGAFGEKHLEGLKKIDGAEVVSLVGRTLEKTRAVADKFGIRHATENLEDSPGDRGSRRRYPLHTHANARRPGHRLHEGR